MSLSETNQKDPESKQLKTAQKLMDCLKDKVHKHNESHSRQTDIEVIKNIYYKGATAASDLYRPGKTRAQWAMARVNLFFKKLRGEKVEEVYAKVDMDMIEPLSNFPQTEVFDEFSDVELSLAKIDLLSSGISNQEIIEYSESHEWELETEAEQKTLNKPFRLPKGSKKKFAVYVKNDKGNVVKVSFGDPNMEIKRDDPERRKSFRARHQCDTNPGPKWKAKYWSCRQWRKSSKVEGSELESDAELLEINPTLKNCIEHIED